VKFNRAFENALLIYNSAQESIIFSPIKISFKIIALNRYKGILPRIPMKIEKITDLKLLLIVKKHDMRTEASRKKYVDCKIDGRASRKTR
jgi:hypothetical protein